VKRRNECGPKSSWSTFTFHFIANQPNQEMNDDFGREDSSELPYEDDEIVKEIDVFVSDKLDLYLLQLPLKPSYMNEPTIQSARYKPECNKLEIEGGIGIPNLQSSNVPKTSNLAFGVLKNDGLHVTPIHEILQLRPSFANFKKYTEDSSKVMEIDDDDEDDVMIAPKESGKPILHQVSNSNLIFNCQFYLVLVLFNIYIILDESHL